MEEMLVDRGFDSIIRRDGDAAFDSDTTSTMMEGVSIRDGVDSRCLVITHKGKLGVKALREICAERGDDSLIVVSTDKPTPPAQRYLQDPEVVRWCSVFVHSEVIRNVTRHHLVPRHARVPPSEIPALLSRWMEKDTTRIPLIMVSDPVAKYHGLRVGEVVHIEGPDGTHTSQFCYRRVISPAF